jgi:preprotein translocase subunit YajC
VDGGLGGLLLPLLFLAVLYMLLIRPQQKRRKEQQQMVSSLQVGDDIVTIGGLHGRVIGLGDKTMDIEVTADSDVVLRFERGSLGRVVRDDSALDDDLTIDDDSAIDDAAPEE